MFDNLQLADPVCRYTNEADLAFATQVADYWAQFVRVVSGSQALASAVCWLACLRGRDRLLHIGPHKRAGFKMEDRSMHAQLALFRQVMERYVTLEQMR